MQSPHCQTVMFAFGGFPVVSQAVDRHHQITAIARQPRRMPSTAARNATKPGDYSASRLPETRIPPVVGHRFADVPQGPFVQVGLGTEQGRTSANEFGQNPMVVSHATSTRVDMALRP